MRDSLSYEDKISLNAASLEELKWWCHNHGCSKIRWLEDTLPGTDNSESVEQGGSTTLHECLRNETSQIGYRVVFQGEKIKINSLTNRQHNSHAPLGGNCSNKERRTKSEWKLYVQTFASATQIMGKPSITPVTSAPRVHVMDTGPMWHVSGWPATKMDTYVPRCISPILSNQKSFKENPKGQWFSDFVITVILITPTWQSQPWYPRLLKVGIRDLILLSNKSFSLMNP